MAILSIKNLSFRYPEAKEKALDDINLDINSGEFVVICGESGCGKTSLLKLLKRQLSPNGELSGEIFYNGKLIDDIDERTSISEIGYVMQKPDNQIVSDKVWHELAFGLESLGENSDSIRRKVAEISNFFGINDWYRKNISDLSGGQKQLLNLASIMVMNPKVLILDEPTSQLDPIAASEFINVLKKINEELAITVIIVEHRLEEVYSLADKVVVMDKAKVLMACPPRELGVRLYKEHPNHKMILGLPSSIRIYNNLDIKTKCPLTVVEGQSFLRLNIKNDIRKLEVEKPKENTKELAIEIKEGFFRYEKDSLDVLRGINLKVYKNEILSIIGGNGVGKTTLLRIINATSRLYRGKIRIWGKKIKDYNGVTLYRNNIATLPQNPEVLFLKSKVFDDLMETAKIMGYSKEAANELIREIAKKLEIDNLLEIHPYDLSVGEQQKLAISKILIMNPSIILLDEPTKGMDAYSKEVFSNIIRRLKEEGKTIIIVTHDIEFASRHSDRCAMLFDGEIVSSGPPNQFFSVNNYYTTVASRISRQLFDNTITCEQVVELAKINGIK